MFVLDTDHVSALERGRGIDAQRLLAKLANVAPSDVVTTIISFEEQTRGWLSYVAKARLIAQQVDAYSRLRRHLDNYRRIPVIDFDHSAAVQFQQLRRVTTRIGSMDLKIAAITLAKDATLLTRNLADFRRIPDLRIENWLA